MTEWEKREETHCQALAEAEKIFKETFSVLRNLYLPNDPDVKKAAEIYCDIEAWLAKWCEEE